MNAVDFLDAPVADKSAESFLTGKQSADDFLSIKPQEKPLLIEPDTLRSSPSVSAETDSGLGIQPRIDSVPKGTFTDPLLKIPRANGVNPENPKTTALANAVYNTAAGFLEFAESPLGVASMALSAGGPLIAKAVGAAYAADMAGKVPEAARAAGEASVTGTTQQKIESDLALATQIALPALITKSVVSKEHPDFSLEPKLPDANKVADIARPTPILEQVAPLTAEALKQTVEKNPAPPDLSKVADIVNEVDKTPPTPEGLPSETQSDKTNAGAVEGGKSSAAEAWDYLRAGIATDAEHSQPPVGDQSGQVKRLEEWAAQSGKQIPENKFDSLPLASNSTAEHSVRYDPATERAVKQTWPGQFGNMPKLEGGKWVLSPATPEDYLHRIELHNEVFGDDIQLEGVISSDKPSMVIGDKAKPVSIVTSQPWYSGVDANHPEPNAVEVAAFLRGEGFEPIPGSFNGWKRSDGVVLMDARPDNFIKTEHGVVPIDLPMTQADSSVANPEGEPPIIGMGGATPDEFKPGGGNATSNKNAVVDQERAQRGLPPMMTTLRQDWGEAWTRAMAAIDRDPEYQDKLVAELNSKPRPITDVENAALLHRRVDLRNEYDKSTREAAQAYDDGRMDAVSEANLRTAFWSDKLSVLEQATKGGGSETGRALAARRMMMNEDFTLPSLEMQKRAANDFRPLTEDERAELKKLADDYKAKNDALEKHLAEQKELASKAEAARAISEAKADAAKEPAIDPYILKIAEKIGKTLHTSADAARERIKARLGRVTFGSSPLHEIPNIGDYAIIGAEHIYTVGLDFAKWSAKMVGELGDGVKPHLQTLFELSKKEVEAIGEKQSGSKTQAQKVQKTRQTFSEQKQGLSDAVADKVKAGKKDEITNQVQRLARILVTNGITDREALIDEVHAILKESMPDISRREAMDAISGYGDFKQLSKDAISVQLRGIKGEMQQLAKLEDMAKGEPPLKTGVERRTPTDAERELIKAVNEAKFKFQVPMTDPSTQLKSALDTLKTTLTNRAKDLQDRIDRGDYAKRVNRELVLDREALKLKAEVERIRKKFETGIELDRLKKRNKWEKTMDTVVKWRRGFILSGPVTLAKLTSAALAREIITPMEEVVGEGLHRAFPSLSERAPRQGGGFLLRAEIKAKTEGLTSGMKDAWQTLTTGHSDLSLAYGKDKALPQSFIEIFGNIHGALKAPVKRAEFARSFEKRAYAYAKQGVDVTDDLVQTRIALEAYADAERAIFMQKNWLVEKVNNFTKARLDKTGHAPAGQKAFEMAGGVLMPIRKVPTNIVAETMQYAIGSVTGSAKLAEAYYKGIENLKPEEADLIMRHLKKGSLGAAALLAGFFGYQHFGGFYQQGKRHDPNAIPLDAAKFGGVSVASYWIHNPWVTTTQLGATVRKVADSTIPKTGGQTQGLSEGAWAGALGLADSTPFLREATELAKLMNPSERKAMEGELMKSLVVPSGVSSIAQYLDKDASGHPIKRDPKTIAQYIKTGIPGLRETVPRSTRK